MTTLYLDLGNTRAKYKVGDSEQIAAVEYVDLDGALNAVTEKDKLSRVLIASVLGREKDAQALNSIRQQLNVPVYRCIVTAKALGVTCAYKDVARLGVDRWLAVLAVWARYRGACVVADLGTAATLDAVDGNGNHLGGYIVSGLELSLRGLLAGTDNIRPHVSHFAQASLLPGRDTAQAIYRGALLALVSLVETSYQNLLNSDSQAKLILAGGDAALVGSHLQCHYQAVEGLVFEGMKLLEQAGIVVDAQ
jgi:type III pantothenate kinase